MCHRGPNQKEAATYSPALHCSTIGAGGLNFSVRNGKRWDPTAITTWMSSDQLGLGVQLYWLFLETISCTVLCNLLSVSRLYGWLIATSKNRVSTKSFNWNYELLSLWLYVFRILSCFLLSGRKTIKYTLNALSHKKAFGQLVVLGFDIAVFTPAPYLRRRLQRPSMEF